MRDLDSRRPTQRLAVEGEQSVLSVSRQDLLHRARIEVELASPGGDPAPRVLRPGIGADEAEEDLTAGRPGRGTR